MLILPSRSLQNGTLINGVCHINQSSVPATRPDGSALVIGDKWYSPSTGVDAFWSGTEWLCDPITIGAGSYINATTTQNSSSAAALSGYRLASFTYQYFNSGTIDSTNRWTFTVKGLRSDGAVGTGYTGLSAIPITTNQPVAGAATTIIANVLAISDSSGNVRGYQVSLTKSGTAGAMFFNTSAKYFRILS